MTCMLHGVNLTGWLVLEAWVTPSLFTLTGASDQASLIHAVGRTRFRTLLSAHRSLFIGREDFLQMKERGFNAVRIPVPWSVFGRKGPLSGIGLGCLGHLDNVMNWAEEADIQVLLVMASTQEGTGLDDDEYVVMAEGGRRRDAMLDILGALARRYVQRKAFIGIEPLDDPLVARRRGMYMQEGIPLHRLRNFYRDAYEAVRTAAGPEPIVVLSAGGDPGRWKRFMAAKRYKNVWLDCHMYHREGEDGEAFVRGVRGAVEKNIATLARANATHMPVMVGEWSAALPFVDARITPEGRKALERVYVSRQVSSFSSTAGWFFQTWKTEGRISAWDARIALASFERGMFD